MHDPLLDQLLSALDRAVEWAGDARALGELDAAIDAVEARLRAVVAHLGPEAVAASPYVEFIRRLRTHTREGDRLAVSA